MRPWRSNIPFAEDSGKLLAKMDLPSDWNVGNGKRSPLPTTEQRARQVLEELPEHYSVALWWRDWAKRSARQMAEATGRSEKANDDVALVTAVLQRDRNATAEFVNTYTDAVYSFIRRRLSPRHDLVDDLVQEVFLAAWESLNSFRGSSPLRAWLLGIARHKVEDYYRRLLQSAQPLDPAVAETMPATDLDIEAIADRERTEERAH